MRRDSLVRTEPLHSVDEIDEGTLRSIEHVARFILGAAKSFSYPRLGRADDAAFIFALLLRILVRLEPAK